MSDERFTQISPQLTKPTVFLVYLVGRTIVRREYNGRTVKGAGAGLPLLSIRAQGLLNDSNEPH